MEQTDAAAGAIRVMQVVIGGLMAGLVSLTVVALVIGPVGLSNASELATLTVPILVVTATGCAGGYLALRRSLAKEVSRRSAETRLVGDPSSLLIEPYRRFAIAGGAIIDGAGVVGWATYMVTGGLLGLGAVAAALVLMAMHMPSSSKLRRLAEEAAPL